MMGSDELARDAGAAVPVRLYANHLGIEFVLSEMELRFGQRFGAGDLVAPQSWLVTSPVHIVGFAATIQAAVARYESRFGAIPDGGLRAPQRSRG